jgi:hypothetical protein
MSHLVLKELTEEFTFFLLQISIFKELLYLTPTGMISRRNSEVGSPASQHFEQGHDLEVV